MYSPAGSFQDHICVNPFTLRAAKTGLAILKIFCLQKYFLKNIGSRNVYQMPYNNSPSNILWILALFPSYLQKYESSRRYFLEEVLSVNVLKPSCALILIIRPTVTFLTISELMERPLNYQRNSHGLAHGQEMFVTDIFLLIEFSPKIWSL